MLAHFGLLGGGQDTGANRAEIGGAALGGTAAQLLSGQDAAWPSVENLIL